MPEMRLDRVLGEAFAPLLAQLQKRLPAFLQTLERLLEDPELLQRLQTLAFAPRWWAEHAPHELQRALRDAAVFPHPNLSLDDVTHLLVTYAEHGAAATVSQVRTLNDDLLSSSEFRQESASRWQKSRRAQILEQILAAHDAALYAVSIPTALAQAEGLVVDAAAHQGLLPGDALLKHLHHLVPDDDFFGPVVHHFMGEFLFARFKHGQAPPAFSRHAILHGGDIVYATRENSVCAVLWVDYLLIVQTEHSNAAATL